MPAASVNASRPAPDGSGRCQLPAQPGLPLLQLGQLDRPLQDRDFPAAFLDNAPRPLADTYTDWDVQQLEASLLETFAAEDEGE